MELSDKQKLILIEELPKTHQVLLNYKAYAKHEIASLTKKINALEFQHDHIKEKFNHAS